MKYLMTILLILSLSLAFGKSNSIESFEFRIPPIDTVRQVLKSINLADYVGKPIDSLLNRLPSNFTKRGFVAAPKKVNKPYYYARLFVVSYANGDAVCIWVKGYRFMNPIDPNKVWNINDFGKEVFYLVTIDCMDGYHRSQDGN